MCNNSPDVCIEERFEDLRIDDPVNPSITCVTAGLERVSFTPYSALNIPTQRMDPNKKRKACETHSSPEKRRHLGNLRNKERNIGEEELRRENAELKMRLQQKETDYQQLKEERDKLITSLSGKEKLRNENAQLKEDNGKLLTRLSALASSRLRDNNPNIADLSDENRPTKIGEKMSELYDNEWTDAFDELDHESVGESDVIHILLAILMRTFKDCVGISEQQMSAVKDTIGNNEESAEMNKSIKDHRKKRVAVFIERYKKMPDLSDLLPERVSQSAGGGQSHLAKYSNRCRELCWYMVVQDPPLHLLDPAHNPEQLDTKLYREYTKRGPFIQYVVWPPVLLYKDGPTIAKGVAQGGKKAPQ